MPTKNIKYVALSVLTRRDHSCYELKEKLLKKFPNDDLKINHILLELTDLNYLNDKRFAQLYCQYRSKKGFGSRRIYQELSQKNVSNDHINCALYGSESPDWLSLSKDVLKKKFNQPAQDFKENQKQKQFLYYRGFTQEVIDQVFQLTYFKN